MEECDRLIKVLEEYDGDLGQKLNKEKTSLFFSKNTPRETREYVQQRFGA